MGEETIWQKIARERWHGAKVYGDGPNAVVVRCAGTKSMHLFSTVEEAQKFRAQLCDNFPCEHKHNLGSLRIFIPAITKPRGDNLRRMMESEP